jgi:hypothetical protein
MRILVITSCTGEKAVTSEKALTMEDFAQGDKHLKQREQELIDLMRKAEELYTGQQHVRLMRGVRAIREHGSNNGTPLKLDLWVLSAGYGLVPGDRQLAPYECTFQGMKSEELRAWADKLKVPEHFRSLVRDKYDLAMILFGDSYLAACSLDVSVSFGGPTLLFCGTGAAKRLPKHPQVKVATVSNPDAKRFSCALVSLKGEIASRLLTRLVSKELSFHQLADPAFDLLASITRTGEPSSNGFAQRKAARPNPAVDLVVQIPPEWLQRPHRKKFRYFIPEWDDLVDPSYDFAKDEHSHGASDWTNAVYAHQIYPAPNYDGLLVSRVVAEHGRKKKARINQLGVHRLLRVPRQFPVMGDCGAFGYIAQEKPPYTTEDIIDYYTRLDFDYGVSVDHLIVTATEKSRQFRYELTIQNAEDFLKAHRKAKLPWEPIGAVQGWDADSYAKAAEWYIKMGYRYVALGGLVRSNTNEILGVVRKVRSVIPKKTMLHVFGVARPAALRPFVDLGVNSVDSASVLRQAWMRTKDSYLLEDGSYAALRIPEAEKSFRAKRMKDHASLDPAQIRTLETKALQSVREYAGRKCPLNSTLDALLEYDQHVTADRVDMLALYRRTLEERPWERCGCTICRMHGVEVVIFRGNNRNRRRGFHNTHVFYEAMKKILAGEDTKFGLPRGNPGQALLFPIGVGEEDDE